MAPATTYSPPEETAGDLRNVRLALDGYFIGALVYGVHVCVFFTTLYFLSQRRRSTQLMMNIVFVCTMFTLGTMMYGAGVSWAEKLFVYSSNYPKTPGLPAGPMGWFENEGWADPANSISMAVYFVANILADGMLLFRAWMLWNRNVWVVAAPAVLLLAQIVTGIFAEYENRLIVTVHWPYFLPYFALHNVGNVLLTSLIVIRLQRQAHVAKTMLGQRHARLYTGIATIFVEAALPYTILGVLYTIAYGLHSFLLFAVFPLVTQVMCIAPQLIILRIALGRRWSDGTKAEYEDSDKTEWKLECRAVLSTVPTGILDFPTQLDTHNRPSMYGMSAHSTLGDDKMIDTKEELMG